MGAKPLATPGEAGAKDTRWRQQPRNDAGVKWVRSHSQRRAKQAQKTSRRKRHAAAAAQERRRSEMGAKPLATPGEAGAKDTQAQKISPLVQRRCGASGLALLVPIGGVGTRSVIYEQDRRNRGEVDDVLTTAALNETNALRSAAMRTVLEVLDATIAMHGDRDAYILGDESITYAELGARSSALARSLRNMGVRRGDVVSLLMPSSIEFAVSYLAVMRLGAIASAVNPRLGVKETSSIVARTEPVVSITPDTAMVGDEWGTIVRVSAIDALSSGEGIAVEPDLHEHDTVAIVWTSGTTGLPKGAMYDHAAMRAIHQGMGPLSVPGDRRVVSLPFAHVGYMTRAWDDIANAVTMILVGEPWSPTEQIRLVEAQRVTMMTGVPTQWSKMLDDPLLARIDTSTLRLAGAGGAAIAPELIRMIRERVGCPVMTRYASTEAGLATSSQLSDDDETIATTVGVASSAVSLRIMDHATEMEVAPGEIGEIRLRSPAMFTGYWRDPAQSAEALDAEGYLRTGDLGYIGPDRNLRIVGRLKDMYIRGGYNVYPVEVEAVLCEHPDIATASVVGLQVPVLGEIGVAFIVLEAEAAPIRINEVRDWCQGQLADYKSPERVVFVTELPINAMHKVDKQILREQAKEHL